MPEQGKSIYKICRDQAGYIQERAAELLNCSVRALARYESGEVPVPDDIAYQMVRLYGNQFLAVEHLRRVSQVAAQLLPPVEDCDFQTAVLRLFNQIQGLEEIGRQLLKIAEDNQISADERPMMEKVILPSLMKLSGTLAELRITAARKT